MLKNVIVIFFQFFSFLCLLGRLSSVDIEDIFTKKEIIFSLVDVSRQQIMQPLILQQFT